ncbi:MAG: hypothetical protein GY710_25640 [Desulfobacteraceae bacterium]|nr:hypothetical protein [Desulfobacteraceae bacterium]
MYSKDQIKALSDVQITVKKYGVKMLADRLEITPSTLYADVDPKSIGRRTNKLGLMDWLVTLEETQDFTSLDAVNLLFNRISLPIPDPDQKMDNISWMDCCATIAKESGEAVAELAKSILDNEMKPDELERCQKETLEALEAFAGLYQAIKKSRSQNS